MHRPALHGSPSRFSFGLDLVLFGLQAYLQNKDVFIQDCYAGADPAYQIKVRVITETAWHSLFARNMFLRELDPEALADFEPDWTVLHCPGFQADPSSQRTRSEAFIGIGPSA